VVDGQSVRIQPAHAEDCMKIVRPVVDAVGGVGETVRDLGRLNEVAQVLIKHGFGFVVAGLDLAGLPKSTAPPNTTPQATHAAIQELGPTFIKLGQVLSTRGDLLPAAYVSALETLQDDVDSLPFTHVEPQLALALGADWRTHFASFDEDPLATASIAQVHRATLTDGSNVVLKVQRPGILRIIRSDLNLLHLLSKRLLVEYPEARSFDPLGVLEEFERSILAELDFTVEADNMGKFTTNFDGDERVRIPTVHQDLSTATVMCMEFFEGVKMRDARANGSDMKRVGDRYLTVAYDMLFVHGFFHGDLHPGNVIVLDGDVLGLIDFGMVGRLTREMRNNVISILFALQRGDYRTIARLFYEIAIKDERVDYKAIERDTIEVMEKHWSTGSSVKDMQMGPYVMDLAARAGKHGARVPAAYTMFFKAIVTSEGLAKSLIHEVDPISAATPYFQRMMADQFSKQNLQSEGFYYLLTMSSLLQRLPVTFSQLVDDIDAQRMQFSVKQVADAATLRALDRRVNRGIFAAFTITCAASGTLSLLAEQTWALGVPLVASGFYLLTLMFFGLTLHRMRADD
jgi:ubiquinone biosynthesis protein